MKQKDREVEELTHVAMFGSRNTVKEAFEFAKRIVEGSTDPSMYVYGTTALMVISNTLSDNYEPLVRKEKENE